ncbi:MAG: hypothetical protein ACRD22_21895, partial [Terriglobia bacterium]
WSFHQFNLLPDTGGWATYAGSYVVLSDGGKAGTVPKFFLWDPKEDVPPNGTALHPIQDGTRDGASGQIAEANLFQLPEWIQRSGWEVVVHTVRVDFKKFPVQNTVQTNHFDIQLVATRLYGTQNVPNVNNAQRASAIQSWDEPTDVAPDGGVIESISFFFGDQGRGGGFYVNFTNLRGIAIQQITVWLKEQPDGY